MKLGCHLSISINGGILGLPEAARSIGASTFQFFTRNPRGVRKTKMTGDKIKQLQETIDYPVVAHAPYTLNPCSARPEIRELAFTIMDDDMQMLESLPSCMYNFHPGSHTGQGTETGIQQTVNLINRIQKTRTKNFLLIETMSGKGTEIGKTFEEIHQIIEKVNRKDLTGVCLDTCHIWDGGYDIANRTEEVLEKFDKVIGLKYLKAVHLNDSKNPLGSHKDRHEKWGEGYLGLKGLSNIINSPELQNLPFLLETPNDMEGYKKEIKMVTEYHN